jgi:cytochrome c55X
MGVGAISLSWPAEKPVRRPGAETARAVSIKPQIDRLWPAFSFWLALGSLLFSSGVTCADLETPDALRRTELIRLVRNDCGSCHGMQLTGGLGLPLTPEALRGKPDSSLVASILYGRPGTPMPPWQAFLNQAEAEWIVEKLKQGFPDVKPQ